MKHIFKFFLFCLFSIVVTGTYGKDYSLVSPDKSIELTVSVNSDIKWSVSQEGDVLLKKSPVSMEVNGIELGINPKIKKTNTTSVDKIIKPVVPNKDSEISDKYNEIELIFKGDYSLIFRAYDDGVAYRFNTSIKEESLINSEQFVINFNGNFTSFFPEEESTMSHNERYYIKENVSEISSERFCSLPVLFQNDKGKSILFTEADLYDYPNMFLHGTLSKSLTGKFPKHALEVKPNPAGKDRNQIITKEADYIAKTSGMRAFPWRVFIIADEDKQLVESNLVFQLSRPNKIENTDWIKPGKVAWDWWNANNVYGVDFEAGINNTTYKYYIDFASEYGLEYIILDEGWTKSTTNILACSPEINVQELVEYGKTKNVEVILWCLWGPLNDNLDAALDLYQSWGVKGIKVDFMQRSDQYMVNYYERVAEAASKRQLLVDYHGAFKPVGLSRTYPNVISYEGVKGMENCKWSDGITPGT